MATLGISFPQWESEVRVGHFLKWKNSGKKFFDDGYFGGPLWEMKKFGEKFF